jgi:ketosteroid isomerase-like protein
MGASENAEVVRRGYEAFNKADIAMLTEIFDENASSHTPGRSPIARDYQGRDAVFGQFGRYGGDTGGTLKAELKQVFTSDDGRVIGLHHNSGKRNGKQLDTDCCIVFEVANGRIVSGREQLWS